MTNRTGTALVLIACALCAFDALSSDIDLSKPVPVVAARTPTPLEGSGTESVLEFTTWKSAVLVNDLVGTSDSSCFLGDTTKLLYSKKFDEWFSARLARSFTEQAVRLGYAQPEEAKSVFDNKDTKGANFRLGATLLNFDYRTCGRGDVKGSAYSKIKWEVFSARRQRVVYTVQIETSFSSTKGIPNIDFDSALMLATVSNLLADPKLAEVIRTGGMNDSEPTKAFAPLLIVPGSSVVGGVSGSASKLLDAVVTVEGGVGSGTAFYISRDGYLLTNQHVVADAKFVRIRLAGGRSVVGEVLRVDKQRDVALLRTDPVTIDILAIRRQEARVGEDAYALGSPFGEVLSGTLTRGVLSAKRVFEGIAFLQSDVAINPGNSGGPLIDASGQVLGITRLSTSAQGINLFIPIDDALDKLGLTLQIKEAVASPK